MKKILPFILLVMFLLTACIGSRSQTNMFETAKDQYDYDGIFEAGGAAPMEAPAAAPAGDMAYTEESANAQSTGSGVPASAVERMVIQNADLAIVVADVEGRMKEINDLAEELGGFVVSSNLYQSYTNNYVEVPEGQIVIRVPAEKLDQALNQIKADVIEVQSETRSGQDVTAEYVDLKSRLKNLEAAEAQLDEIMQQATETEDVVNVFNQLVYYREQIELVKGQIKYYEEAASLSAISVRVIAEATVQPLQIAGWEPKGVAQTAIQNLIYFYQDFADFLINFTLYTLPVLITIGIPLYLIFLGARALYRRSRANKPKQEVAKPVEEPKKKKK
jgi:hypothetical protein